MQSEPQCVAGFGHVYSLWFHFVGTEMVGYTIETPMGRKTMPTDVWFQQHMLIVRTTRKHPPKQDDVLPYLSHVAGTRAVQAISDYNVYELAIAFTAMHSWQLINGAKLLPDYGELAKVYAGVNAVYLFKNEAATLAARQQFEPDVP